MNIYHFTKEQHQAIIKSLEAKGATFAEDGRSLLLTEATDKEKLLYGDEYIPTMDADITWCPDNPFSIEYWFARSARQESDNKEFACKCVCE